MNEREWVERMISEKTLGDEPVTTIGRLAKYYYAQRHGKTDIIRLIREFMLRCDSNINIDLWMPVIESRVRGAEKYKLVEIDHISITESEIMTIKKVSGVTRQKVLFTLLCAAKYANAVNPKNTGWVNADLSQIFSMANTQKTKDGQQMMIYEFGKAGLVKFSHIVDNTSLRIPFVDDEGDEVLRITDLRNLGNQYLRYIGEPYIECCECGLVVKRRSPTQKYCVKCAPFSVSACEKPRRK